MSYSDRDYQRLSQAIVTDFVSKGAPLQDSVIKVADEMRLNAHETRRLVEATNVSAHLTLFEKQADHKYVEFDIVCPDTVIDRLFAAPDGDICSVEKGAFFDTEELPDERWEMVRERIEKTAAEAVPELEEPVYHKYAGVRAHYAIQTVNRIKDELENELLMRNGVYMDKIAKLREQFRYLDACTYGDLEKDAYAMFEVDDIEHPLLKLREALGHPPTEKVASRSAIVLPRREHTFLKEAVEAFRAVREVADGIRLYQAQAGAMFVE